MFARKVAVLLKPDTLPEFTNLMEREILPWLRKQEGFLDLITLAVTDSREVATISFWDHSWTGVLTLRRLTWSAQHFKELPSGSELNQNLTWRLVRHHLAIAQQQLASEGGSSGSCR
jgi:hypothetical protein